MRGMIRDEEDLLKSVMAFVKGNLNERIMLLNALKDDWTIPQIKADDAHYVFSGELLDLPNHAFVSFAIDSQITVDTNEDVKASTVVIVVEVVFDNPKKANTYFTSLRYLTALYQTLLDYEASTDGVDGFQINKITPIVVNAKSLQRELVISGVTLSAVIS